MWVNFEAGRPGEKTGGSCGVRRERGKEETHGSRVEDVPCGKKDSDKGSFELFRLGKGIGQWQKERLSVL